MKKSNKPTPRRNSASSYDILRRCVGVALALVALAAAFTTWRTGLLTTRLAVLLLIGLAAVGLLVFVLVRSKHRSVPANLLLILLALAVSAAGLYVYSVAASTSQFLTGIQKPDVNYETYAIIAKKERHIQLPQSRSVAVLGTGKELTEAVTRQTPARQQTVADLTQLIAGTASDEHDIAVLRQSFLDVLREYDTDFYDQIEVLRTFRIQAGSSSVPAVDTAKPYAIYISGIDTYGAISAVSRSDVNMLAVLNPQSRKVLLVNTPRDYYVQLHGTTGIRDKLTHAGVYGIDTSRQTMEDLYGVAIPYYVRVNFTSLVGLVDVIGGIEVNSPYAFNTFEQGYNTLDGKSALAFSRERYSFKDGDRQRGKNQQLVIEAIVAKLSRPENATRLPQIMNVLSSSVQTNMPESLIKGMIRRQLDDTRSWQVNSMVVDGTGAMLPTYTYGNTPLYVMVPDTQTLDEAKRNVSSSLQPE